MACLTFTKRPVLYLEVQDPKCLVIQHYFLELAIEVFRRLALKVAQQ